MSSLSTLAVRGYRLLAILLAAWLIHVAHQRQAGIGQSLLVSLPQVQQIFPNAARLQHRQHGPEGPTRHEGITVLAADGEVLGQVFRTSPETDDLVGYSGPNDLLVGLSPDGKVVGVQLLSSGDTADHVRSVRNRQEFWTQFDHWRPASEPLPAIEAVSGSTLTSLTIAEAIQRRLSGKSLSLRFPEPVDLAEARVDFPAAASLVADTPRPGWLQVQDSGGKSLGYLLRTSPVTDSLLGYAGPSESLLAIGPDQQTILDIHLRKSYDTPEYVERVVADPDYAGQLAGVPISDWPTLDFRQAGIEGISGATQTSYAVAEGIRRRLQADQAQAARPAPASAFFPFRVRDAGLLLFVAGALWMTFAPGTRKKRWRRWWQILVVGGLGLWQGDLLSLALLAGWSRNGTTSAMGSTLILLVSVSLLVPWFSKQQIYCHQLCPHGAAQEWLGRFRRCHVRLPARLSKLLGVIPGLLLMLAFGLAICWPRFELAWLEPFDGWSLGIAALISFCLAVLSLASSIFVPQGYCRFGCPTGALLKFVRSHGQQERFGRREAAAALLLALAGFWLMLPDSTTVQAVKLKALDGETVKVETTAAGPRRQADLAGQAFGTTWSVRFRQTPSEIVSLNRILSAELERIEQKLSHWQPGSETAQFNASETTLELEYSQELIDLVTLAQSVSVASGGAYDITVGPLVDAWGYGPTGPLRKPPTDEQIQRLLAATGADKLNVIGEYSSLQKTVPELKIDLGSLLHGYAADRLHELLKEQGEQDFLIDVGGELRCAGSWQVGVDRIAAGPQVTVRLANAALATSGTYRPAADGTAETRHLISPRTGRPAESPHLLCSVVAPTALQADVWATALFLVPRDQALRLAGEQGFSLLLIDRDGQLTKTGLFAESANP